MNRYKVTRQAVNCGPMRELNVVTLAEARRAFDIAVSDGDVFAEIFDMEDDMQILWHLTPATHRKF